MRVWIPERLYEALPWSFVVTGVTLTVGMMLWSLTVGLWTVSRGLLCFGGAALAVVGGITVQLRQEYRARAKWRRETRR